MILPSRREPPRALAPSAKSFALACAAVLQVGCAPTFLGTPSGGRACAPAEGAACAAPVTLVEILEPLLETRIERLTARSASFRNAWDAIRASGVRVTIGTAAQVWGELPSSFQKAPSRWAGVTVVHPDRAVVALQLDMIERFAESAQIDGRRYLLGEVDRLLIHEIYGHLAPMIPPDGPGRECPDEARPGEARACVEVREEQIARELASYVAAVPPSPRAPV